MARNHSTEKRRWLLLGLATLAAAFPSLINTKTTHATDDNTVSISVDQSAELKPVGNLHKATTNVTVKTSRPYGFNLTLHATGSPDLVNQKDGNHRIKSLPVSNDYASLAANQWGYNNRNSNMYFYGVPDGSSPAVVADVTKAKPAGCINPANCTKSVTFAANVDPAKLASGSYSTVITYTATAKPKPAPTVDPTICKSGDPKNDCQVDIDPNMIPVKYTGTTTNAQWTSLANPEDSSNQGNWYNYNNKQWANAITVKSEALSKYKNQTRVVDQADILGYWVYIPRYAYEVMRRDGTDKPVPAQNFLISFEKTTTPKRHPAACPEKSKDYRTECDLNRDYIKGQSANAGTWATHPAFTFGTKELNGIWFAKFETTGTTAQPTVLPNEAHISGEYSGMDKKIGNFYSLSKTLGINDPQNVGGGDFTTIQNNHHLSKLSSHMVNNNDWGAATYLSASKYGAGYDGVRYNPENDNTGYNYNTGDGQLTSTTNNPTGIYDMSGGGWEYVAASYTSDLNNSNTKTFGSAAHPPYVNTYNITNMNSCTFNTCGGQALYETNDGVDTDTGQHMWNGQNMYFKSGSYLWFARGCYYGYGPYVAGLFCTQNFLGYIGSRNAFRVAFAPL